MPCITKNQGSLAAALAPKSSHCVQAWGYLEHKPDNHKVQDLQRIAWIAHRIPMSLHSAALIAGLCFGEVRS